VQGPWETVATVAERKFVDEATPSGVRSVSYRVRGQRSGGVGFYSSATAMPMGVVTPTPAAIEPAGAIAPAGGVRHRAG
ncbi:MAG: hypothetical protein ACIAS6_05310, partial [Phycisphaerales bacterium JB060]